MAARPDTEGEAPARADPPLAGLGQLTTTGLRPATSRFTQDPVPILVTGPCWWCWRRRPRAERLAFVLHDMFAMPFDEIARMPGRSPDTACR